MLRQRANNTPTETLNEHMANDIPSNGSGSDDMHMRDASPPVMPAPLMQEKTIPRASTPTSSSFPTRRGGIYGPRPRAARSTRTVFTAVVQVSQTTVRKRLFANSYC